MSEHLPTAFHDSAFLPRVSVPSHGAIARGREALSRRLPDKDSLYAAAFLLAYLAAYVAAGRAGIAAVEWAWVAIFR